MAPAEPATGEVAGSVGEGVAPGPAAEMRDQKLVMEAARRLRAEAGVASAAAPAGGERESPARWGVRGARGESADVARARGARASGAECSRQEAR